jgi:glycyl-tRNA synthetase
VSGENFFPHVIEPSFGVGRILYAILEQNFYTREDSAAAAADEKDKSKKGDVKRAVLSLPPHLAPVQCSVLPLLDKDEFNAIIPRIVSSLKAERLSTKVDSTGQAIGRRYARTDEIGIPFGITIDHQVRTCVVRVVRVVRVVCVVCVVCVVLVTTTLATC